VLVVLANTGSPEITIKDKSKIITNPRWINIIMFVLSTTQYERYGNEGKKRF
jgi:hypothetical protein